MKPKVDTSCVRPLEIVVRLLGRQWTVPLILLLGGQEAGLRYSQIRESLVEGSDTDISDSTLSRKLSELTDLGILHRQSYDEVPPRVEYCLTESGMTLFHILSQIAEWTRAQCHNGGLRIPRRSHLEA